MSNGVSGHQLTYFVLMLAPVYDLLRTPRDARSGVWRGACSATRAPHARHAEIEQRVRFMRSAETRGAAQ